MSSAIATVQGQTPAEENPDDWNLVMDPTEEEPEVLPEGIYNYSPGGFHPVHLGDRLGPDGRYRVVDKLGHGGWGTVWLCHDENESRWRAVKIHAARVSDVAKCKELETAKEFSGRLGLGADQLLEHYHIALPIRSFTIQGPNGTHLAIVYPLLGPTVDDLAWNMAPHPELLKDICFQLVQAMHFLHLNGRCHGDFRPSNILIKLAEGVDQWPEAKLQEVLGKPTRLTLVRQHWKTRKIKPAERSSSRPEYLVGGNNFDYTSGVLSTSIAVSDFGVSYPAKDPPKKSAIPGFYASPEDIITGAASVGYPTDVWTLMNTILDVRLNLQVTADEYVERVLENCEMVMGPMPKNYRTVWKQTGSDFRNGHEDDCSVPVVLDIRSYPEMREEGWAPGHRARELLAYEHFTYLSRPLWDAVASQDYKATGLLPRIPYKNETVTLSRNVRFVLGEVELEQLYDLCMSVYKWQPEDRALTGDIISHPWFGDRNKRAGMALLTAIAESNKGEENSGVEDVNNDEKPGVGDGKADDDNEVSKHGVVDKEHEENKNNNINTSEDVRTEEEVDKAGGIIEMDENSLDKEADKEGDITSDGNLNNKHEGVHKGS